MRCTLRWLDSQGGLHCYMEFRPPRGTCEKVPASDPHSIPWIRAALACHAGRTIGDLDMTQIINGTTVEQPDGTAKLGRGDPLLQELWSAKAALNAAADYRIEQLADQAASFDINAVLAQLNDKTRH